MNKNEKKKNDNLLLDSSMPMVHVQVGTPYQILDIRGRYQGVNQSEEERNHSLISPELSSKRNTANVTTVNRQKRQI